MKFDLLNHLQAPSKGNKIFGKLATLTQYILEVGRYIRILKKKRPNTKYMRTNSSVPSRFCSLFIGNQQRRTPPTPLLLPHCHFINHHFIL